MAKCNDVPIVVSNTKTYRVKHLCDINKEPDLNNFKKNKLYSFPCCVEVNTSVRKLEKKEEESEKKDKPTKHIMNVNNY